MLDLTFENVKLRKNWLKFYHVILFKESNGLQIFKVLLRINLGDSLNKQDKWGYLFSIVIISDSKENNQHSQQNWKECL